MFFRENITVWKEMNTLQAKVNTVLKYWICSFLTAKMNGCEYHWKYGEIILFSFRYGQNFTEMFRKWYCMKKEGNISETWTSHFNLVQDNQFDPRWGSQKKCNIEYIDPSSD